MTVLEDPDTSGWNIYYNEPTIRIFYKQEEGQNFGSTITDSIIDADITRVVACYDNFEIIGGNLMKEFYDLRWEKKVTDIKGVMYGM